MRIGITCHPTLGGSGTVATDLGVHLARRGHQVHFISYELPYRLTTEYDENVFFHEVGVTTYPLFRFPPYSLALAARMAEVAERQELDLFHVHYAIPHATCAILAQLVSENASVKVIATLHGTDITYVGKDPSFFRITKFSIERSDAVTAVSHWLKRRTQEEFQTGCQIHTIYNFVDPDVFKRRPCDKSRFSRAGEKIVMHMSNFRPVKRVGDVVAVFDHINRQVPSRLVLVGDGPELSTANLMIEEAGLADRVEYLGAQDRVEDILPCADLVLLPSEYESFGLAALEAMACEIPVVASNGGGLTELIEDQVTGFLVEVGDVQAMARRGIDMLTDADAARQIGVQARQRAVQRFNPELIVGEYERLYSSII
jgi:N-acetyl-alpha-D-glucosaminyl L-malate synthase BshA